MGKGEKIHILGIFRGHVPVHPSRTECVLVHVRGVPVHPVLLSKNSTSFCIFAITSSFLIRSE